MKAKSFKWSVGSKMHECYFLNVVLLPKRTPRFYNALCVAFYHLPQPPTVSPSAWSLSSANTVGCRSFATCRSPAVSVGGRISALHQQRVQAQLTDQEKLPMLRGMQSLHRQTVSVLLACQLNREKTTSLKLIVPRLAIIGCQGAKWIRNSTDRSM